jgi:hypothetical protein
MRQIENVSSVACALIIASVFLSGCLMYTARFSPPVKQESQVVLRENDFRYVERSLEGSDSYWTFWIGVPPNVPQYEIYRLEIPLSDPRIYSNALADLYSGSREQAEGKTTQLINWTVDEDNFLLPLLMRRKVTFSSDLIEYTK